MKAEIASDHGGIELKVTIIEYLNSKHITAIGVGTNSEGDDFPDFAVLLGEKMKTKEADLGILICRTGIGMCVAANKIKGIMCANVHDVEEAYLARSHNDINVISISASLPKENVFRIIDRFVNTTFSNEERRVRRNNKIRELENM
jgi:ribose 5-phosphate isomerase B